MAVGLHKPAGQNEIISTMIAEAQEEALNDCFSPFDKLLTREQKQQKPKLI